MNDTTAIDDLGTWLAAYQQACTHRDQWADVADRAKQQITQRLDEHTAQVGTIAGRPAVKWNHVASRRIDTKALKEKDPELAELYTVETSTRRFTLIGKTDDTDGDTSR